MHVCACMHTHSQSPHVSESLATQKQIVCYVRFHKCNRKELSKVIGHVALYTFMTQVCYTSSSLVARIGEISPSTPHIHFAVPKANVTLT